MSTPQRFQATEYDSKDPLLAELEANGQWELIGRGYQLQAQPGSRWQAGAARAYAFLGDLENSRRLLNSLYRPAGRDLEVATVCCLTLSLLSRRAENWRLAKFQAMRAFVLARRGMNPDLLIDAAFAVGLCLLEEGRVFLALDCFQRISQAKTASAYRLELCALNECWILWDLGQSDAFALRSGLVPPAFAPRIELMVSLVNLKTAEILEVVNHEPFVPYGEKIAIALLLLEWNALESGAYCNELECSWVAKLVSAGGNEADAYLGLLQRAFRLLKGPVQEDPPATMTFSPGHWRLSLESAFFEVLARLHRDPQTASAIYSQSIEPILAEQRLRTPLIPSLSCVRDPDTPWGRKLSMLLGRVPAASDGDKANTAWRIRLHGHRLELCSGQNTEILDFESSPVSLHLLRLLAHKKGETVTKRYLHEQLTGTRYAAHLHDARLHKLLMRLKRKIHEASGLTLWTMFRDNTVTLQHEIEVLYDAGP